VVFLTSRRKEAVRMARKNDAVGAATSVSATDSL